MSGRGTPAVDVLTKAGVSFRVHEYERAQEGRLDVRARPSYGLESAAALGVDPGRVFKTLVADVDGTLAVGIVPVSGELDLKALAAALGGRRATMAAPEAAERATGYVVGGISPFGQRRRLRSVVDTSALAHDTVFVSGGRRGLQIELAPADLVAATGATTGEIARRP